MILYKLLYDEECHGYAVPLNEVTKFNDIVDKDWDDWSDDEINYIDSLTRVEDDFYIVLEKDLKN